jgi:hypothetical protein
MSSDFAATVVKQINEKKGEYRDLKHKKQLIDVELERIQASIARLNAVLVGEGQKPIPLDTAVEGSVVRRPGNRAKDYPVRRVEWEGMPIRLIIKQILAESLNAMHGDDIARKVYEIQSDIDLKRVKPSLVSQLHRGSKLGWWEATGHNTYKKMVVAPDMPDLVPALS